MTWAGRLLVALLLIGGAVLALRPGSSESAAVHFRDPVVWVPANATGELVEVNGATGEVMARAVVGEPGDDLAVLQRGTDAVVLNRTRGELSRVAAATVQQVAVVAVSSQGSPALLDGGERVHVVAADRLTSVDAEQVSVELERDLDDAGAAAADEAGEPWFVERSTGSLRHLAEGVVVTGAVDLPAPDAMALVPAGGEMLVVDGRAATVAAARDGRLVPVGCLAAEVAGPFEAAAGASSGGPIVAVTDPAGGILHLVGSDADECRIVDLGTGRSPLGRPLVFGGQVFVPYPAEGVVVVVDPAAGEVRARIALPGVGLGNRLELFVKDRILWFDEPDGSIAGILDDDRVVRVVDKLAGAASGAGIGGVVAGAGDEGDVVGAIAGAGGAGGGSGASGDGGDGGAQVDGGSGSAATGVDGGDEPSGNDDGAPTADVLLDDLGRIIAPSAPDPQSAISPAPLPGGLVADFTYSSGLVGVGDTVTFTDRSQGGPTAWTWDFGDGTVATGPDVSHVWSDTGIYTVTLLVENATAVDQATVVIRVVPPDQLPPRADFTLTSARTEVDEPVTFTSTSTGRDLQLRWEFGEGTTATGPTARMAWTAPGEYLVRLTASNDLGTDTAEILVTVVDRVDAPRAVIAPTTTNLVVGQSGFFSSASTGNPTTVDWDFGDGTTARGADVRHAWAAPGTYTVTLTVANRAGRDRATLTVTVAPAAQAPTARFSSSASIVETGTAVTFTSTSTGDPTSLSWDFGDGTTGTGATVSKTYARPGSYTVRLTASNAVGTSATTRTVSVVANVPPPVPVIAVSPETIRVGDPVQFSGSSTGGPVSSWSWSFGDGGSGASSQNPGRVFTTAGTFTVTLTAENLAGSATTSRAVTVLPARPVAAFTFAPNVPAAGTAVQFTDASTGTVDSWSWAFGDGQTSSMRNPSIAFAAAGTYDVTLTVTNAGGSSTVQRSVSVNPPPPVASFSAAPTAFTGQSVTFTDTSNAVAATYAWDFGGIGGSTARVPTFAFPAPGSYVVTLTVTNAAGSDTASRTVVVTNPPAPVAGFTVNRTPVTLGRPVTFTDTSVTALPAEFTWDFGDSTGATGRTPAPKVYATPGTYTVTLRVQNAGGVATATAEVRVVTLAQPAFTATETGAQVLVQDLSTGAEAIRVDWGDGSAVQVTSPGAALTHDYVPSSTEDLVFTVRVAARNEAGDWSDWASDAVTIPAAPPPPPPPPPPP